MSHSRYNLVTNDMQSKDYYFIPFNQLITDIPSDVINLFMYCYGNSINGVAFPRSFSQLKSIVIGQHCFVNVCRFVIDDLPNLESMTIGAECFTVKNNISSDDDGEEEEELKDMETEKRKQYNGICRITNCPSLRQLEIGYVSYGNFKLFELSNLNSLQSIEFGDNCCVHADLLLKGE